MISFASHENERLLMLTQPSSSAVARNLLLSFKSIYMQRIREYYYFLLSLYTCAIYLIIAKLVGIIWRCTKQTISSQVICINLSYRQSIRFDTYENVLSPCFPRKDKATVNLLFLRILLRLPRQKKNVYKHGEAFTAFFFLFYWFV